MTREEAFTEAQKRADETGVHHFACAIPVNPPMRADGTIPEGYLGYYIVPAKWDRAAWSWTRFEPRPKLGKAATKGSNTQKGRRR